MIRTASVTVRPSISVILIPGAADVRFTHNCSLARAALASLSFLAASRSIWFASPR